MRLWGSVWGIVLLLVACAGSASASGLAGTLVVSGELTLPASASGVGTMLAVRILPDQPVDALHLTAAHLNVTRHEWRVSEIHIAGRNVTRVIDHTVTTYALTDVDVTLLGGAADRGLVFLDAQGLASIQTGAPLAVAATKPDWFGDQAVSTRDADDPRHPGVVFSRPMLRANAETLAVAAPLTMTLFGPNIELASAENTTSIHTGSASPREPVGERVDRALVLEGAATVSLRGAIDLRIDGLASTWDGLVAADGAHGTLREEDAVYVGNGTPLVLEGRLDATVRALDKDLLELGIAGGNLKGTTMTRMSSPQAGAGGDWTTWGGLALLGLAVVAGGTLTVRRRVRRAAPEPLDADALVWRAEEALEDGRIHHARTHLEAAAALAPSSTRVQFDLAYLAWRAGDADAAISRLEPLEGSPERAEALLLGARILAQAQRDGEAATKLLPLLEEFPVMLLEVEDAGLERVATLPHVRRAMAKARRALQP